ncbi:MAG TPA: hypothetical protein VIL60_11315 [Rhodanobacter sp.]
MTSRIKTTLFAAIVSALVMPVAFANSTQSEQELDWNFQHQPANGLVQAVRAATADYQNVARAIQDGYHAIPSGCVSSPDQGAMGVHYVRDMLFADGAVDVRYPEALVYEPMPNGRLRLVAAEYITFADFWDTSHPAGEPVTLMGQLFDYEGSPNRFRLPASYGLHVWAWKYNPKGAFSMWNPRVSCAYFTGT